MSLKRQFTTLYVVLLLWDRHDLTWLLPTVLQGAMKHHEFR